VLRPASPGFRGCKLQTWLLRCLADVTRRRNVRSPLGRFVQPPGGERRPTSGASKQRPTRNRTGVRRRISKLAPKFRDARLASAGEHSYRHRRNSHPGRHARGGERGEETAQDTARGHGSTEGAGARGLGARKEDWGKIGTGDHGPDDLTLPSARSQADDGGRASSACGPGVERCTEEGRRHCSPGAPLGPGRAPPLPSSRHVATAVWIASPMRAPVELRRPLPETLRRPGSCGRRRSPGDAPACLARPHRPGPDRHAVEPQGGCSGLPARRPRPAPRPGPPRLSR
jgi:hypothetical protein